MPSQIQLIGKLINETIGIVVRYDGSGSSFKGQSKTPGNAIFRVSGATKPREGCQITFEITTIPLEEKLLCAPILQAMFGPFPGVFTVKSSIQGATIYYRLQYPLTAVALNATIQIVKDLEQVRAVAEEIRRYLPIKPATSDLKGLFDGLSLAKYIPPLSERLATRVEDLIPGDSSIMIDMLLGQRILFLEVNHFYQRDLILGWLATKLQAWNFPVAQFIARRYTDPDLLDLLLKVPFALAADISDYVFQHLPQEIEKLAEQVCEISRPLVAVLYPDHHLQCQNILHAATVSLVRSPADPLLWIDYFLETYEPALSHQEVSEIKSKLIPVLTAFSESETTPEIIMSCIQRYLNKKRNDKDHLKCMKEYLFKVIEI